MLFAVNEVIVENIFPPACYWSRPWSHGSVSAFWILISIPWSGVLFTESVAVFSILAKMKRQKLDGRVKLSGEDEILWGSERSKPNKISR